MEKPQDLCDACGKPLYYDPDSGLYLHERQEGQYTDKMNGLFCTPEEWGKPSEERRYARPIPHRIPVLTKEELESSGFVFQERLAGAYGYWIELWARPLTDEWYVKKGEQP